MWILHATVDEEPVVVRLPPGAARTLGRGTSADFIVADALISRVHCRLTASAQQLVIEDLQSTNGTYVNGVRLKLSTLEDGDRVRLGQVEFNVVREDAPTRRAASARSSRSGSRRPGG